MGNFFLHRHSIAAVLLLLSFFHTAGRAADKPRLFELLQTKPKTCVCKVLEPNQRHARLANT
ncbi:hypothetical protein CSA80_01760 [Candidatus Saccharibacteria bacterium]|nr:MAG: hypothetical protein CSA80_01760 [Candidatus Saccharibacteria bacterium]